MFECSPSYSLPGGPRLSEASRAAWGGGGWGVVGREELGPGSAVAVAAARVPPEEPEEEPRPWASQSPASLRTGLGAPGLLLCRPVWRWERRLPAG